MSRCPLLADTLYHWCDLVSMVLLMRGKVDSEL